MLLCCTIDVRTQAMYQMMDEGFVGLIFSVFNEDKQTKVLTCFVKCALANTCTYHFS